MASAFRQRQDRLPFLGADRHHRETAALLHQGEVGQGVLRLQPGQWNDLGEGFDEADVAGAQGFFSALALGSW